MEQASPSPSLRTDHQHVEVTEVISTGSRRFPLPPQDPSRSARAAEAAQALALRAAAHDGAQAERTSVVPASPALAQVRARRLLPLRPVTTNRFRGPGAPGVRELAAHTPLVVDVVSLPPVPSTTAAVRPPLPAFVTSAADLAVPFPAPEAIRTATASDPAAEAPPLPAPAALPSLPDGYAYQLVRLPSGTDGRPADPHPTEPVPIVAATWATPGLTGDPASAFGVRQFLREAVHPDVLLPLAAALLVLVVLVAWLA